MIHDFATVPRYDEPLVTINKTSSTNTNSPIQLRWLLVVVFLCSIIWFSFFHHNSPESELIPGHAASIEYQEELDVLSQDEYKENHGEFSQVASSFDRLTDVVKKNEVKTFAPAENRVTERVSKGRDNSVTSKRSSSVVADAPVDAEYGFYDRLRTSQWAVPVQRGTYVSGELSSRKKAVYKLQAASFRHNADARRLVRRLVKLGLAASMQASISTDGAEWYQVSVGPFTNVSKMNKAQNVLVSLNMMPLKKRI